MSRAQRGHGKRAMTFLCTEEGRSPKSTVVGTSVSGPNPRITPRARGNPLFWLAT